LNAETILCSAPENKNSTSRKVYKTSLVAVLPAVPTVVLLLAVALVLNALREKCIRLFVPIVVLKHRSPSFPGMIALSIAVHALRGVG
jgi:hypothetical protein